MDIKVLDKINLGINQDLNLGINRGLKMGTNLKTVINNVRAFREIFNVRALREITISNKIGNVPLFNQELMVNLGVFRDRTTLSEIMDSFRILRAISIMHKQGHAK